LVFLFLLVLPFQSWASLDSLLAQAERTAQWDVDKALLLLQEAQPLAMAQTMVDKKVQCLALMGDVYAGKSDFTAAVDHYLQAIRVAETSGREDLQAKSFNGLGTVAYQRKDYAKAEEYFLKAAQLKLKAGKIDHYAMIVTNLSGVMFSIGKYNEAMVQLRQALPHLQKYDATRAAVYNSMGSIHQLGFQRLDSAEWYYDKAIQLGERDGYNDVLVSAYHNRGEICKEKKDYPSAIAWLNKALLLSEQLKRDTYTLSILQTLSEAYRLSGQWKEALTARERAYSLLEQLGSREKQETVERLQIQFEAEKKSAEIARKNEALLASELKYEVLKNKYVLAVAVFLVVALVAAAMYWSSKQKRKNEERIQAEKYAVFQNIVHEIRTPLTLISGPLRLISASGSTDQLKAQLPVIERNADRLLRMVQELLQFSKIESGQFKAGKEVGDPVVFIRKVSSAFTHTLAVQQQELIIHEGVSRLIEFPKDVVDTAVTNLLSNAIRYAGKGALIQLFVVITEDRLQIAVQDNGPGIDAVDADHLFDRFYRGRRVRETQGNGLGLALVKEMVTSVGGTLAHRPAAPQGVVFEVSIPITDTTGLLNREANAEMPVLLLVEDDSDLSMFVQALFHDDVQVMAAFSLAEARQVIREVSPDIILTDIALPDGSGLTLLDEVKASEQTAHIPVAVFSARADAGIKQEALNKSAAVYFSKPFVPNEMRLTVLNVLNEILGARKSRQEMVVGTSSLKATDAMHPFLEKCVAAIHAHLDDSEFGPDALAEYLAMSRSQLHRKLVSLSSYSTSNFIRVVRLRKAKEILNENDCTVKEVAYMCGFNNPSYFSKSYKELFGHSPGKKAENEGV
jgi:signal transduction histidine kinase/DNA-binding response OmpR family regulator